MNNQVCKHCGSQEVARCKWVNVNTNEIYDADSGTWLEWCFGACKGETTIIDASDFKPAPEEDDEPSVSASLTNEDGVTSMFYGKDARGLNYLMGGEDL